MLHRLVYDLHEGLLREMAAGIDSPEAAEHLADMRASGVPAGPPSAAARVDVAEDKR